jgi:hypothetical protein
MRGRVALLLILCLLAASCSNFPSDWLIRSQVTAALTAHGADELYDIENFKVVGGRPQGDGSYVASVRYDIVLKKGIKDLPNNLAADPRLIGTALKLGRAVAHAAAHGEHVTIGSHIPVQDDVTLVKKDGNWVLD